MKLLAACTYVCKYIETSYDLFEYALWCSNISYDVVEYVISTYRKSIKTSETTTYFENNVVKKTRFENSVDNIHITIDITSYEHDFENVVTFTITKD